MLHSITKLFTLSCLTLLVAACTKNGETFPEEVVEPISFYDGDVLITISDGAPISTRSSNASYITLSGQIEKTTQTVYIESFPEKDHISVSRQYSVDGQLMATLTYFRDTLIDVEIEEGFDNNETLASAAGERFSECFRNEYKRIRDSARDHNPFFCDIAKRLCPILSAFVAAVECSKPKDPSSGQGGNHDDSMAIQL